MERAKGGGHDATVVAQAPGDAWECVATDLLGNRIALVEAAPT